MDYNDIMEEMTGQSMLKPIALKKFLEDYKKLLESDMIQTQSQSQTQTQSLPSWDTQTAMGLADDSERFMKCSKNCSLRHLDQPDDRPISTFIPGKPEKHLVPLLHAPPEAHKLQSFKAFIESKNFNVKNPFRRSGEVFKLASYPQVPRNSPPPENPCDYYNDLLISIRVYRPMRATHIGRTLEKPVFSEQFQCLGSNLLSDLRDKITCICNKHHFYDISENPDDLLPTKNSDPGFFFITNTFYNDRRNPKNADYSSTVLKWARRVPCLKTTNFKTAKMENTRFIDLNVSLGFPQVYQHHGNCEHLFTFSQVEVLTPLHTFNQAVSRDVYPRLHSFSVFNKRLCNMCGVVHYVYIVVDSDRQLQSPAYLCSKCFHTFHYIDGKKIGEFRAFRLQDFKDVDSPVIEADDEEEETNREDDSS